jgi:hypothetical protein
VTGNSSKPQAGRGSKLRGKKFDDASCDDQVGHCEGEGVSPVRNYLKNI